MSVTPGFPGTLGPGIRQETEAFLSSQKATQKTFMPRFYFFLQREDTVTLSTVVALGGQRVKG